MNATTLVQTLVDMVSKNGNLLLDIGPRADGTIVDAEAQSLREAGQWIHAHAAAIFNTTYWFIMSEVARQGVRFTQADDAFYIFFLVKPSSEAIHVDAPLPLMAGDEVTVMGGIPSPVEWEKSASSSGFTFFVPESYWEGEKYCWVLKISY